MYLNMQWGSISIQNMRLIFLFKFYSNQDISIDKIYLELENLLSTAS